MRTRKTFSYINIGQSVLPSASSKVLLRHPLNFMSRPSETFELPVQAARNAHQFFITRPLCLLSPPSESFELPLQTARYAHQFFTVASSSHKSLNAPITFFDNFAHWTVKRRYGCRAMMLETVAGMLEMVGGMLLHCKLLRRFEQSGGWIKAPVEETENERMHLMTFMEVAKTNWYECALVFAVQDVFFKAYFVLAFFLQNWLIVSQGVFFNAYSVTCILCPKLAHRLEIELLKGTIAHNIRLGRGDGDEALSNGKYKSVWHRAIVNSEKASQSVASFLCPSDIFIITAPKNMK